MEPMEEVPLIGWVRIGEISAWLPERSRQLIPETRGSILEGTIRYSQRRWRTWTSEYDQRWRASAARRLNSDKFVQIWRLSGCENFVDKWKEHIIYFPIISQQFFLLTSLCHLLASVEWTRSSAVVATSRGAEFFSLNFLITTMFVICDSAEETQRPAEEWLIRPLMKPQPSANRNQCRWSGRQ